MTTFSADALSSAAIDVLMQLFVSGPIWDGNLISKDGRTELISRGLAFRVGNGWQSLTEDGVRTATEWDRASLRNWHDRRWYEKLRDA